MKVLIVTPSYKPAFVYGGPTFSVSYLATELLNKVDELLVLTTTANGKEELNIERNRKTKVDGVDVIYFARQTKDHSHFSFGLFQYLWKNCNKYNCVHIQSWWNLVAIISAIICMLRNVKFIVSPRGMLSPYTLDGSLLKRILHRILGQHLLKKSILHATSSAEIKQLKALDNSLSIQYAPNFIKLVDSDFEHKNSELFQILFLSRIHNKKGLEVLFKALSKVHDSYRLHIVGDGDKNYTNSLKALASNLKIESNIIWHGPLYDDEKYKMYANADVMILPSKDENFANNVLESLSVGTAVILSNKVGLSEFVSDNDLGWVYDSSDFGLYISIEEAIHNKSKLQRIRTDAKSIVYNNFSPDKIVSQYLKIYKSDS